MNVIRLTPKFPREGRKVIIPVKNITGVFDGFVQISHSKYIAVTETKEQIQKLLKEENE